jgi:hypothetical protein
MVRRIVNGVAYDTDAASLICEVDDGINLETFWSLYRSPNGAWFMRVYDVDGRDDWDLLSDAAARAWLERNGNHLVETYFGKMPDVLPKRSAFKASTFLIKAIADVITGGSANDASPPIGVYRSGPRIEDFFLDCGFEMSVGSMSRVPATQHFVREIAERPDAEVCIRRVIQKVCDPRQYYSEPEKAVAVREHLNRALEPDGFAVTMVDGKAHLTERKSGGVIVESFIAKVSILDFDTVQTEIARALPNIKDDPEDAVTAACSLIEAVCRSILIELGLELPPRRDIEGLLKAVQEPLGLSPARTDLPTEIAGDVRQILGGLTSVAKGIGALRTHGGDAHGREKGFRRMDERIARLAINAASSLALFLIETWERKEKRALPKHSEPA